MGRYDDIINLSRPESRRQKMSLSDRAKIFAPFAALRGYDDAVGAKRAIYTERKILSDDASEELDRRLAALEPGDTAEVVFFRKIRESSGVVLGVYDTACGEFGGIDTVSGYIMIGGKAIRTADITEIIIGD